jgi:hypothetical protein
MGFSDPVILQSADDNRGIYILAGRPRGERFMEEVITPITERLREMRRKMKLPAANLSHRRGEYGLVSVGFSLGPGSFVRELLLCYNPV